MRKNFFFFFSQYNFFYFLYLSKKYKVPAVVRTVKKIEKNIVWVQGISYPFELPTTESIELKDIIFAKTILVNGEWYLR